MNRQNDETLTMLDAACNTDRPTPTLPPIPMYVAFYVAFYVAYFLAWRFFHAKR
jgi:hypothetical protein